MIAAIYARKSTDDSDRNEEARSTTRQVERATEYATANGWTVDPRYVYVDEAVSGAEWKHRAGFNALLDALEPRPPFGILIVSELSRIGRDTARTPAAILQIEEAGVTIHGYLSRALITMVDEPGEMSTVLNSMLASFERRRAKERTLDALHKRFKAGAVTGGRVFGYTNYRNGDGYVHRALAQDEAETIRRVFTLYANGQGLTRIAKALTEEGTPSPRGSARGRWRGSTVREILYRDLYRGVITWNRTQKIYRKGKKSRRRRDPREWLTIPAPELRIIDDDLWNAAHARLAAAGGWFARMRTGGKLLGRPSFTDSEHLLTGFTTCAVCGGSIVTEGRRHGSPGKRHVVRFYGCTTNRRSGPAACANRTVLRQEIFETAVLDDIARKLNDRVESAIDLALARLRAGRDEHTERRGQLERELAQVDQRIQRGLDAILDGVGIAEEIHARLRAEKTRKATLAAELERLRGLEAMADVDTPAMRAQLVSYAEDVRALLAQDKATPLIRQALRKVLDGKIVAEPTTIDGRPAYRYRGRLTVEGMLSGEAVALARSWWPQRDSNPCLSGVTFSPVRSQSCTTSQPVSACRY